MSATPNEFWQKHRGLVRSNPAADDSVHLQAALLRTRFSQLLDLVVEVGVKSLRQEWVALQSSDTRDTARAHESVERILTHIERGFTIATARN
jgi:hypothetical protein